MKALSRRRKVAFYVIAAALPVLLLLLAEGALRLAGFGQHIPLFVAAAEQGYIAPNPKLVFRYVPYGNDAPKVSPDTYYLKPEPAPGSFRIVVMGGSTAAGFPYGRFGSPAGMLQQQLIATYPDEDIEVISVALSAINSYALRDMADEVAAIKPDAILIYAGHNEYLGIMGADSAFSGPAGHMSKLIFLWLRESRLFQLLSSLMSHSDPAIPTNAQGRTVMALMAQHSRIAYDSPVYRDGEQQLLNNMSAVLRIFEEERIPVYLSSIASNESFAPFVSLPAEGLPPVATLMAHKMAQEAKLARVQKVLEVSPTSANAHFALGSLLVETHPDRALSAFTKSIDYDLLRFRAPSSFNAILKRLAQKYGAVWVDGQQALRNVTTTGLIGDDVMLEHLHPNDNGYFYIASAFHQALASTLFRDLPHRALSQTTLLTLMPVNDVDRLVAAEKIKQLKADFPFSDPPKAIIPFQAKNSLETLAADRLRGDGWLSQQPSLITYYQQQGDWLNAAIAAGNLHLALPFDAKIAHTSAQLWLRAGDNAVAGYFARHALTLSPDDLDISLTMAECYFKNGDVTKALNIVNQLHERHPDNERIRYYLAFLRQHAS